MEHSELRALYEQYGYYVYRRALRLLCRPGDAEDTVQDVFLKLLEAPAPALDARGWQPWLNRVVTNHCLNRLRHAGVRERYAPMLAALPTDETDALHRLLEQSDLVAWLLQDADAETREVVGRYFFDEEAVADIARALAVSVPTIRRRLRAFLERARARAERERAGWAPSAREAER